MLNKNICMRNRSVSNGTTEGRIHRSGFSFVLHGGDGVWAFVPVSHIFFFWRISFRYSSDLWVNKHTSQYGRGISMHTQRAYRHTSCTSTNNTFRLRLTKQMYQIHGIHFNEIDLPFWHAFFLHSSIRHSWSAEANQWENGEKKGKNNNLISILSTHCVYTWSFILFSTMFAEPCSLHRTPAIECVWLTECLNDWREFYFYCVSWMPSPVSMNPHEFIKK